MKNTRLTKILFMLLFAVFNLTVFAIEEDAITKEEVVEQNTSNLIGSITFEDVQKKAIEHSYDLKLADFDTLISHQEVRGAKSEYFPKIFLNASTEYNKNFRDVKDSISTYVGDTYVNPYTRYQSLFGISLAYNVFDFGVRNGYLNAAKQDEKLKKLIEKQQLQELNLNLIDAYLKILITKKQIDINNEILALSKKNFDMKKRLYKAKEISKPELNQAKVEKEKAEYRLSDLKSLLAESLNLLSFYTGEEYEIENIQVADLTAPDIDPFEFNDYTQSLNWIIHNTVIKKKEFELQAVKKTNYPKVNMYSRYYLYGSNINNYGKAFGDIEPSNWSIGASINMPVFDGMKNRSNIEKTKLELQKAYVEQQKDVAQLKNRLSTMRTNFSYLNKQIENNKTIISELTEKEKSTSKLLTKKIVSPIELVEVQTELLNEKIEYVKNEFTSIAILKGIETLTTYDKDE